MVLLTLPLEVFIHRNYVAEFMRFKLICIHKNDTFAFWATLWGLRVTYTHFVYCSLESAWSTSSIRDNLTFSPSCYGWDIMIFAEVGAFQREWVIPTANFRWRGRRPKPNESDFATSQWRPHDPIFIRLITIPACDGQNCRRLHALSTTGMCWLHWESKLRPNDRKVRRSTAKPFHIVVAVTIGY